MHSDSDLDVTVLAVDDEEFNLDLIELAFAEKMGVQVLRAENGRVALDLLATLQPDVILLDLAMPVLNGFETLKVLKAEGPYAHLPVIVVTANKEEKNKALAMGANDFLAKPVDVDELVLRTLNYAKIKEFHDYLSDVNFILEEKVGEQTRELSEALELALDAEREIAFRVGRAADFRDNETGSHIRRMSHYAAHLARLCDLPPSQVELVLHASPLHDIGKIGIPDAILRKPGKLTDDEYATMKLHPAIGGQMLEGCEAYPLLEAGRIIALQHHEKWDGTGYPEGLKGEEIHLFGRITALADVFDALSCKRVYKPAMSLEAVCDCLREQRDRHFDPRLVDLFLDHLDDFLAIKDTFPDSAGEPNGLVELAGAKS